ncbi:MAG TPA: polysaccharide biosynthesis/export family protein [Vicinamibacterales bacterium]|nr:polysaccharide biosynthesis/export family protein [Vicinamibacterales bacterium]
MRVLRTVGMMAVCSVVAGNVWAQTPPTAAPAPMPAPSAPGTAQIDGGVPLPADYVIGPADVLQISFWKDTTLTSDVTVRPDGRISFWLINDIQAAGLTPEQLREKITTAASKFFQETPTVLVSVKAINSRQVFITGEVAKPGPYPLLVPTTVLQLIATAGGLLEYADSDNITVIRVENGQPVSYRFNYKNVAKRKAGSLKQNILLKPGDSVVVP